MKPNPNLDELLSSFIDGELSPRQRTEVQRMAAHDPAVARRLRQLQNCRTLVCALPPAEAPGDLLEQIRQSLERKTLLQEQPVTARRSAGVVHLMFRRFVAAAAMIALVGVLGVVVYQIVAPVPGMQTLSPVAVNPHPPQPVPDLGGPAPVPVVDRGFSGRLELATAAFAQVDAFVQRAVESFGSVETAHREMAGDRRVYRVVGTRDSIHRLMASLGGVWQEFDSATLHVSELEGSAPVTIEAVTPDQMVEVVARKSTEASVETAQMYAAMNWMARTMPGREIAPLIDDEDSGSLFASDTIPMPKLAGPVDTNQATHAPPQGTAPASLTIVLLRSSK